MQIGGLVWQRSIPRCGAFQTFFEADPGLPTKPLTDLGAVGKTVGEVPLTARHVVYRLASDIKEALRGRDYFPYSRLSSRPQIVGFAVVSLAQLETDLDECARDIVNVDKVARDVRIDKFGILARVPKMHDIWNQAGGIFQRAVGRIQAEVHAGQTLLLAEVLDQTGGSHLRNGIMTVRRWGSVLSRPGRVVAI